MATETSKIIHRVRTYAPGYSLFLPKASAAGLQDCPGCAHLEASPECAACGAPTAKVLRARKGDRHHLPLCLRCWRVVREWRAEARAEKAKTKKTA